MFFQSIVKMLYIGKKLAFIPLGYLQLFYKPNQFAEVLDGNRQIQRKQWKCCWQWNGEVARKKDSLLNAELLD